MQSIGGSGYESNDRFVPPFPRDGTSSSNSECRLREFMEATFGRDLVRSAGNAALVSAGQGNTLNSDLLYH